MSDEAEDLKAILHHIADNAVEEIFNKQTTFLTTTWTSDLTGEPIGAVVIVMGPKTESVVISATTAAIDDIKNLSAEQVNYETGERTFLEGASHAVDED